MYGLELTRVLNNWFLSEDYTILLHNATNENMFSKSEILIEGSQCKKKYF
jgi:hypothetical protein